MGNEFNGMIETMNSPVEYSDRTEYIFQGPTGSGPAALAVLREMAAGGSTYNGKYIDMENTRSVHNIRLDVLYLTTTDYQKVYGGSAIDGGTEIEIDVNEVELPLERHPDYLARWNNDLYCLVKIPGKGETVSLPEWPIAVYDSKTRKLEDKHASTWKYSKTQPPDTMLDGENARWYLKEAREKDAEVYPVSAPIVTVRKTFKGRAGAKNFLKGYNTFESPPETPAGVSSGENHWIKKPMGFTSSGGMFVATVVYKYADEWDIDFYG